MTAQRRAGGSTASRLLRSRTGQLVALLAAAGLGGAVAVALGSRQVGPAIGFAALTLLATTTAVAVVRLQWTQLTQQRAVKRALVAAAPGAGPTSESARSDDHGRGGHGAVGRHAARSPVARDRDDVLEELDAAAAATANRTLAGVISPDLADKLASLVQTHTLRPWLVVQQLENLQPGALVVDERALRSGVWFGVEGTSVLALTEQLLDALAWCRSNAVPVLGVRAGGSGGVHTPAIRAAFDLTFPASEDELRPHGIPLLALHQLIQDHATAALTADEGAVL